MLPSSNEEGWGAERRGGLKGGGLFPLRSWSLPYSVLSSRVIETRWGNWHLSFQSQLLPSRKQANRLLQAPHFRFLLFGGINPSDVHPPVGGRKGLEQP